MGQISLLLAFLLSISLVNETIAVAGTFDSANIRNIKTEVSRIKDVSESIFNELKKQKEITSALQTEFKSFQTDIKAIKKALLDVETLMNKTVASDTQFIREKLMGQSGIALPTKNPVVVAGNTVRESNNSTASTKSHINGTSTSTTTTTAAPNKIMKMFQG